MATESFVKHHVSQLFDLPEDAEFDFFDANLEFDSPVFIDPFLLKKSPLPREAELFDRFTDYFRYVYDKSSELTLKTGITPRAFERLLTFHEPKNIYMGYTEDSNDGKGPNLTKRLLNFFLESSAKRFVRETEYFPDHQYNPVSLQVFTDGVGPDGISDITANLIMDYLIEYTIEQAQKWNMKLTPMLALNQDGFDFEAMEWRGGAYYSLPENPLRKGEPIILVPRRLLRGFEEVKDNTVGRVVSILRADPQLSEKFSGLLSKAVKDISTAEIRAVFMQEGTVHYRYLQSLEQQRQVPYDFSEDFLGLLSDKDYSKHFANFELGDIDNCDQLKSKVEQLIGEFSKEFSKRDGWKDAWKKTPKGSLTPQTEPVIGRRFRGMGFAFFCHFENVTFIPEAGTGNGLVDFHVIYKSCRIVIELKLLNNSASKGKTDPIPAYLHGIQRQLPEYIELSEAKHGYYVTGQHFDGNQGTKVDHTYRIDEIQKLVPVVEAALKGKLQNFGTLNYVNIEMMPRESASKL